jgi:hypothetical protein
LLTRGGIGSITGEELKYNPENADEGIWFVPSSGGTAVRATVVANRTEGNLVFIVPTALPPGSYTLEVRKGYGKNAELRTGSLHEKLEAS